MSQAWQTTGSAKYDRDEFYVRSKDDDKSTAHIRTNAPASVAAQMDAIVQQRSIPDYRTREDIVRDALVHRLHYLNETRLHDPRLQHVVEREMKWARLDRIATEHETNRDRLNTVRRNLSMYVAARDWTSLKETLYLASEEADEMHEPWASDMWQLVQDYRGRYQDKL